MSPHPTQDEDLDPGELAAVPLDVAAALDRLARALRGRIVPARRSRASGRVASPAEGLALVEDFHAIGDPELRQLLLDAAAALASGAN